MSSSEITKPVELVRNNLTFLRYVSTGAYLHISQVDWNTGRTIGIPDDVACELVTEDFAKYSQEKNELNLRPTGLALMSKLLVNWDQLVGQTLEKRYYVERILAGGSESVTYLASHISLGSKVCLKVIRPGCGQNLSSRIRTLSSISENNILVLPTDLFNVTLSDINNQAVELNCVLFPFIDSPTLESFLNNDPLITPFFVLEFLAAISTGLAALEQNGLVHGDLHERNILCKSAKDRSLEIKIIDIGIDEKRPSEYGSGLSDFEWLKRHIGTVLRQTQVRKMSIQKHLGAPTFELLKYIFSKKQLTFREILSLLTDNSPYNEFKRKQNEFIISRFSRNSDSKLSLLRHEEINDPSQARDLFQPYLPLDRKSVV